MTLVGMERFLRFRQREEIQALLKAEPFRLTISTGEISRLERLFLEYLERLHDSRTVFLRAVLKADGGWPLHLDATGEGGRGTLLVVLSGWRRWVLKAQKIPTENADAILPSLHGAVDCFGAPCAIMRDLGRATTRAAESLVQERKLTIPILACHAHFLKDVGTDLLEPTHAQLRAHFRQFNTRSKLRALCRDLGRRIGGEMAEARLELAAWQQAEEQKHIVPEGRAGLAVVRALAQWVLDYMAAGTGAGFPFDRPYLDFHSRCAQAGRAISAFLCNPSRDKGVAKAIENLHAILKPVTVNTAMGQAAVIQTRRAALFDELRDALRLPPTTARGDAGVASDKELAELRGLRDAVKALTESLRQRRPRRGPAVDQRQAIDILLRHLDDHGGNLWGHAITIQQAHGQSVRLVDRTNNIQESFFHAMKHGERRRSGRKNLTKDFEKTPHCRAMIVASFAQMP